MVGAAGAGGLVGGFAFRGNQQVSFHTRPDINLSPIEAISFRFPNNWHDAEPVEAASLAAAEPAAEAPRAPARYAVASVGMSIPVTLNSKPIHQAVNAKPTEPAVSAIEPEMAPPWVLASLPPLPKPRPKTAPTDATVAAASTTTTVAANTTAPAAPKPAVKSNAVLNPAQLASIKRRLNLTPDQERYWPAVEAELRKMEYKKGSAGDTRTASIDTSKMNVQGLRTAGFPLVMSFSDDQRRELKSLAHLLGLEGAMSGL